MVNFFNVVHLLNNDGAIDVGDDKIETSTNPEHFEKTDCPIDVTEEGISNCVKLRHS